MQLHTFHKQIATGKLPGRQQYHHFFRHMPKPYILN